jgi:hypothetical protein
MHLVFLLYFHFLYSLFPPSSALVESLILKELLELKLQQKQDSQRQLDLQRKVDEIPRIVAQALPPPPAMDSELVLSPAHLAIKVTKLLKAQQDCYNKLIEPLDGSGTPMLNSAEQSLVAAVHSEAAMVARLTPYLWRCLCGPGSPFYRSLVNSETKKWLEVEPGEGQLNQKPDLWLGPGYIVEVLPAPANTDGNAAEEEAVAIRTEVKAAHDTKCIPYIFGKPASQHWFDSVFPLAAKLSLTDTAIGEEMIYLKHLSDTSHPFSRGMAYDKEKFVLLKCVNKKISWRLEGYWTQRGSFERIRDFFSAESQWEIAIRRCCAILAIQPVRYLGCGGTARVIEVRCQGQLLALKTVLEPHIEQMADEYCRLRGLIRGQSSASIRSVLPDAVGSHIELLDKSAAAFLISPIGESIERKVVLKSQKSFLPIFMALRILHTNGQRHGDPRLPNLLWRKRSSPRQADPTFLATLNQPTFSDSPTASPDSSSSSSSSSSSFSSPPASSSSSSLSPTICDPILSVLPNSNLGSLPVSTTSSLSSTVLWIDFMVSNARTTLDSGEHRFDDDLLLFVSFLANRKFTRSDAPDELRNIMREYHHRLTQTDGTMDSAAFFAFLRQSARLPLPSTPTDSSSPQ